MDHQQLEREIAIELSPFLAGMKNSHAPRMRRETVFSMLSQPELQTHSFADLISEAGYLVAAVLDLEYFAGAEITDSGALRIRFSSLADNATNIPPHVSEVEWKTRQSAFTFAIEAGHPIVIANAGAEPRFQDAILLEHSVRAGVVCPINYRDQQYGGIGYFSSKDREFTKDDVAFLNSISLFLGPARAHQMTERTLAVHSQFLSRAIDSLEAIVVLLNADGKIMQINRACQNIGEFSAAELRGRRIWSAFWQSDECSSAESAIAKVRQGETQAKCEAFFITKHGNTRRVVWTFAKLPDGGAGPAILATGIDITEQFQAMKKVDDLERRARYAGLDGGVESEPVRTSLMPIDADPRDRRIHDRRPFQCIQLVAPCLGRVLPSVDQFCEVRCYDICPSGFSFLLPTRPAFDELIAAFGATNSRLYLQSKVKHITPIHVDGRHVLLIGCEYVRRVRIPNAGCTPVS